MPRAPRYDITGVPQYATQTGHNLQPLFRNATDFCVYRDALKEALTESGCALHAFRLCDTRVHLLVTQNTATGVAQLMQYIGRRYAAYFNRTYARSGALFSGRYKSTLVQPGRFAFACQRFIDEPCTDPSAQHKTRSSRPLSTRGQVGELLSALDFYLLLGSSMTERGLRYRQILQQPLPDSLSTRISGELERNGIIGDEAFIDQMESFHRRSLRAGKPGRPRRKANCDQSQRFAGAHIANTVHADACS